MSVYGGSAASAACAGSGIEGSSSSSTGSALRSKNSHIPLSKRARCLPVEYRVETEEELIEVREEKNFKWVG